MAFLYFPNGAWNEAWVPKKAGADFELPFSLSPLEKLKNDVVVLSGLDKAASHEGDGHYAKTANFLTGAHVNKTTGRDISAGGISIDQLAAQKYGDATPLPSMELGIDPVVSGIDNNVGYTRLYASYISWRAANLPVAREINPRAAYDRLFGAKDANGRPTPTHADDDCRLLDMALEDAGALRRKLGRDDQVKVDEYLEAVRAVEKQVQFLSKPDNRRWKPPTKPTDLARPEMRPPHEFQQHVHLMLDLLVLAFWTDSTRIGTFMFANDVSGRNFAPIIPGVSEQPPRDFASSKQSGQNRGIQEDQPLARRAICACVGKDAIDQGRRADAARQLDGAVRLEHVGRQSPRPGEFAAAARRPRGRFDPLRPARRQPARHAAVQSLRLDARPRRPHRPALRRQHGQAGGAGELGPNEMASPTILLAAESHGRLFTAADLAALPTNLPSGDIDFELDQGRLVLMVPPGHLHGAVQVRLGSALFTQAEQRGYGRAFTEVGVVLSRRPDTVLGPDAVFISSAKLPVVESPEGYLETIPDLAVEVRSRNDSAAELDRKIAHYLGAGVRVVWIADPKTKTIAAHRAGEKPRIFSESETLTIDDVIPGFRLAVADVFPK